VKQRLIRVGDELTDDVAIVVRGGDLDPEILRHDALRNHCPRARTRRSVRSWRALSGARTLASSADEVGSSTESTD
jgi:hypothetical protein